MPMITAFRILVTQLMTYESSKTKDIIVFMNWFKQNSLKANPEKNPNNVDFIPWL